MKTTPADTNKAPSWRSLLRWVARPFTSRIDRRIDFRIDQRERELRAEMQITHAMIDWQINALRGEQAVCKAILTDLQALPPAPNGRVDVLATWLEGIEQVLQRHQSRADELQAWLVGMTETVNRLPPPEQTAQLTTLISRMERATSRMSGDRKEALALNHRLANIESVLAVQSDTRAAKGPASRVIKDSPRAVQAS